MHCIDKVFLQIGAQVPASPKKVERKHPDPISTHILDTSVGTPAAGVEVILFRYTLLLSVFLFITVSLSLFLKRNHLDSHLRYFGPYTCRWRGGYTLQVHVAAVCLSLLYLSLSLSFLSGSIWTHILVTSVWSPAAGVEGILFRYTLLPSVFLSLSLSRSIFSFSIYLSIFIYIYLSIYLSIYISIYLYIYISIYLSIFLHILFTNISIPVFLCFYLFVLVSVSLSALLSFYPSL